MKNSKLLLVLLITLFSFSSGFAQKIEPGKVETKLVVINGDNAWTNTRLVLKPSDKVTINASGQVFFSNGNELSGVSPDGMKRMQFNLNWEFDSQYCNDPVMNVNHAALIAKVGGSPFILGKSKTFSGKTGQLVIGINDCTFKNSFYNTGQFQVNIKVVRGK